MSRIPFPLRRIKAIASDVDGVLSSSTLEIDTQGTLRRTSNLQDIFAIRRALAEGSLRICLLCSSGDKEIEKYYSGQGLRDIMLNVKDKPGQLGQWVERNNIHPSELAYIGRELDDLECMSMSGLPIAPQDAPHECLTAARYVTDACGGAGVYRELIEQILADRGQWLAK